MPCTATSAQEGCGFGAADHLPMTRQGPHASRMKSLHVSRGAPVSSAEFRRASAHRAAYLWQRLANLDDVRSNTNAGLNDITIAMLYMTRHKKRHIGHATNGASSGIETRGITSTSNSSATSSAAAPLLWRGGRALSRPLMAVIGRMGSALAGQLICPSRGASGLTPEAAKSRKSPSLQAP